MKQLQQKILIALGTDELSGEELRKAIGMTGWCSLARFYRLMSKMEDQELVEGWYKNLFIEGYHIKQRWYKKKGN